MGRLSDDGGTASSGTSQSTGTSLTPWGPRVAVTGDSKVATNTDAPNNIYADSWLTHAWLASGGDLDAPINAGHGGYTSTQLAALFDSEVIAKAPNVVIEDMGTNDSLDGSNQATTTIANLTTLLGKCRAIGVPLVITTLTPVGTAGLSALVPTLAAPGATQSATGGTIAAATYSYRVSATNGVGETQAGNGQTVTVASGTTNSVVLEAPFVPGATGYKFYKSTDGGTTYGLIGSVTATGSSWLPVRTFTDTGIALGAASAGTDTTSNALTTANRLKIATINAAKKRFAAQNGLVCLDFYGQAADPTSGMWKTGWTRDGTHPTPTTSKTLGQYAWAKLSPYFRRRPAVGTLDPLDPLNLFPGTGTSVPNANGVNSNGTLQTGSGTQPSNWAPTNPAGGTTTRTTRTGHNGNAYVLTRTTWATTVGGGPWFTTIPGHVYALTMVGELVGPDANGSNGSFGWKWHNNSGSPTQACNVLVASDFGPSRFTTVVTAPTGATQLEPLVNLQGEGTAAISEVWCVDLTALGLT